MSITRRQFIKGVTLASLHWWVSPLTAFAQGPFPFPSIEIEDKPVLMLRAGLSSLGGMKGLLQQGRNVLICPTMRYLPPIGYGRNTDPQIVQELILQSLNAGAEVVRVLDTPWATPERCARASGLRRVCDAFDANMLVWPTRTSEYVFCPLPGTSFSGLHIVKAALEADAIIFAPHALPDVDCCESQFMLYMLMGLVKERYSFSIAQQYEDVTRYILSLLSTKLLVIDKQMETVCPSN